LLILSLDVANLLPFCLGQVIRIWSVVSGRALAILADHRIGTTIDTLRVGTADLAFADYSSCRVVLLPPGPGSCCQVLSCFQEAIQWLAHPASLLLV